MEDVCISVDFQTWNFDIQNILCSDTIRPRTLMWWLLQKSESQWLHRFTGPVWDFQFRVAPQEPACSGGSFGPQIWRVSSRLEFISRLLICSGTVRANYPSSSLDEPHWLCLKDVCRTRMILSLIIRPFGVSGVVDLVSMKSAVNLSTNASNPASGWVWWTVLQMSCFINRIW